MYYSYGIKTISQSRVFFLAKMRLYNGSHFSFLLKVKFRLFVFGLLIQLFVAYRNVVVSLKMWPGFKNRL